MSNVEIPYRVSYLRGKTPFQGTLLWQPMWHTCRVLTASGSYMTNDCDQEIHPSSVSFNNEIFSKANSHEILVLVPLCVQLREPLLLIGVFLLFFAIVILYCRCNFVLTRGSAWEAENKAERTAFLVEEITSIIAGKAPFTSNPLWKHRKVQHPLNSRFPCI